MHLSWTNVALFSRTGSGKILVGADARNFISFGSCTNGDCASTTKDNKKKSIYFDFDKNFPAKKRELFVFLKSKDGGLMCFKAWIYGKLFVFRVEKGRTIRSLVEFGGELLAFREKRRTIRSLRE